MRPHRQPGASSQAVKREGAASSRSGCSAFRKKKRPGYKPGYVGTISMRLRLPRRLSRRAAPSFIYAARLPAGSSGLPPGNERAAHLDGFRRPLPVYLTLQPIRRAARHLAMASVGSYPAFSPLPRWGGGAQPFRGAPPP